MSFKLKVVPEWRKKRTVKRIVKESGKEPSELAMSAATLNICFDYEFKWSRWKKLTWQFENITYGWGSAILLYGIFLWVALVISNIL